MNYPYVFRTLGKVSLLLAALLVLPLVVAGIYQEEDLYLAFILPIMLLFIFGISLVAFIKPKKSRIYAKEGVFIVSLTWLLMSVIGALPFVISRDIPNFFDALFEIVSGFTATGFSTANNIEALSRSILFWRGFSNWIGGMGVIVFFLAFFPKLNNARSMYILRAESPGHQVDKMVSKMKLSTRIIYIIYIVLTIICILLLWIGGMPLFDSIVHGFATAGTGGFSVKNLSIAAYHRPYIENVIAVFMLLFGVNFNIYYLILVGQMKKGILSEELRWYIGIVTISILLITFNILHLYGHLADALRLATFQVSTVITTTGFSTADFSMWPAFSQSILLILFFIGGMAGSTSGGMKVSRIVLLWKLLKREIYGLLHPNEVKIINFEKRPIEERIMKQVGAFMAGYLLIILFSTIILSLEVNSLLTSFTTSLSLLSNVGLAFDPSLSFSALSNGMKAFLSLIMITGRLELFPIFILFNPRIWNKV